MFRRGEQSRSALASRDTIGQAKGMLMERFQIDAAAAFGLLKRLSQDFNTSRSPNGLFTLTGAATTAPQPRHTPENEVELAHNHQPASS